MPSRFDFARTDGAHEERVVAITALVQQQLHGAAVAGDQQIEVAIVVDVALGERTAHRLGRERRPGLLAHASKPIAGVAKQQARLRVLRPLPELGDVVHDVAVDDREVAPAVVVEVHERDAEPHIRKRHRSKPAFES